MQEDAFPRLVWSRTRAQGAPAAQAKSKLEISGDREKRFMTPVLSAIRCVVSP